MKEQYDAKNTDLYFLKNSVAKWLELIQQLSD